MDQSDDKMGRIATLLYVGFLDGIQQLRECDREQAMTEMAELIYAAGERIRYDRVKMATEAVGVLEVLIKVADIAKKEGTDGP